MNTKRPLYTVPAPSTEFRREAFLDLSGVGAVIRYSFEADSGVCDSGIAFKSVAASRMRGERCCSAWHIEGAYDTLVEVLDSTWVSEMRRDVPEQYAADWEPRHFMIYLDSVGCFELLASDWGIVPDSRESD